MGHIYFCHVRDIGKHDFRSVLLDPMLSNANQWSIQLKMTDYPVYASKPPIVITAIYVHKYGKSFERNCGAASVGD